MILEGTEIEGREREELIQEIRIQLDSVIATYPEYDDIGVSIYYHQSFIRTPVFYVWLQHPVHAYKEKLFLLKNEQLTRYMRNVIHPEREEGKDMTVTDTNFSFFIMCNHDGNMYLLEKLL